MGSVHEFQKSADRIGCSVADPIYDRLRMFFTMTIKRLGPAACWLSRQNAFDYYKGHVIFLKVYNPAGIQEKSQIRSNGHG
jgi:hypothetical protein